MRSPNLRNCALQFAVLALACLVAYAPFLSLPLISDDYLQLFLGQKYGAPEGWADLANDVLYRCRATSLFVTQAVSTWFGMEAVAHRLANVVGHWAVCVLLAFTGRHPKVGYAVSLPAALFYAIHLGHQEAVVWSAALPEVLVGLFLLATFVLAERAFSGGEGKWLWPATVAFLLALASKESGVVAVPFLAVLLAIVRPSFRLGWFWLAGLTATAALYALSIFAAKDNHLHLNDGTFVWGIGFVKTMAISIWRLLLPWGLLAGAMLWHTRSRRPVVYLALGWIPLALLPYSFVGYMDRVPSRHTYLASLGLALLVGAAIAEARSWAQARHWQPKQIRLAAALLIVLMLSHNLGFLWMKKVDQFARRAELTERFLLAIADKEKVVIGCAAYALDVYKLAAHLRLGRPLDAVTDEATMGNSSAETTPALLLGKPAEPLSLEGKPNGLPFRYCDPEMP